MFGFNLLTWLDKHNGTVSAALTLVLAVITYLYVRLTRRYVELTSGLLDEARTERNDRHEREMNEQARHVGGYLEVGHDFAPSKSLAGFGLGIRLLTLNLVNASPLPVRRVIGHVYRTDTGAKRTDP